MASYVVGQIVYSKRGRDKSRPFVVFHVEDEYLYLVDGELRKLYKPKKKKIKHVQPTNYIDQNIKSIILESKYLLDNDIKKTILKYKGIS